MAKMTFEFLDVGMGDGTFVMMGDTDTTTELALIDLGVQRFAKFKIGADDAILYLTDRISAISKARGKQAPYLDHLFITHHDSDHYNRIVPLIEAKYPTYGSAELTIGKFTYGGRIGSYPSDLVRKIRAQLVDKNYSDLADCQHSPVLPNRTVRPFRTFAGGQVNLYLLSSNFPKTSSSLPNPLSLCLMFQDAHNNKVILMGDAETDVEAQIIENYKNATPGFLNAFGLKLGHHGTRNATSPEWVKAVKPSAVFASGDLVWSHPYCEAISRVDENTKLENIFSHWFCCGGSREEYREYFNRETTKAVCLNLWYVVKDDDGEMMMDEETDKETNAQQGMTYGVQWELEFTGAGAGVLSKTDTSVPV